MICIQLRYPGLGEVTSAAFEKQGSIIVHLRRPQLEKLLILGREQYRNWQKCVLWVAGHLWPIFVITLMTSGFVKSPPTMPFVGFKGCREERDRV